MSPETFNQAVMTLNDLGLTIVQAKVYMALLKSESSTIQTIANHSHIARTDLYRITHELEKKGLIERILAHPTQYKPVPITEALPILLQRKNQENSELQTRALKLLKAYK